MALSSALLPQPFFPRSRYPAPATSLAPPWGHARDAAPDGGTAGVPRGRSSCLSSRAAVHGHVAQENHIGPSQARHRCARRHGHATARYGPWFVANNERVDSFRVFRAHCASGRRSALLLYAQVRHTGSTLRLRLRLQAAASVAPRARRRGELQHQRPRRASPRTRPPARAPARTAARIRRRPRARELFVKVLRRAARRSAPAPRVPAERPRVLPSQAGGAQRAAERLHRARHGGGADVAPRDGGAREAPLARRTAPGSEGVRRRTKPAAAGVGAGAPVVVFVRVVGAVVDVGRQILRFIPGPAPSRSTRMTSTAASLGPVVAHAGLGRGWRGERPQRVAKGAVLRQGAFSPTGRDAPPRPAGGATGRVQLRDVPIVPSSSRCL